MQNQFLNENIVIYMAPKQTNAIDKHLKLIKNLVMME